MNANDVRDCLLTKWPANQYVMVSEAPDGPERMGRKIDALVVSCWKSRGYEIDAVEIKVSMTDWMREVNNPAKSEFWVRHSHRFWVAVPSSMSLKVKQTLPPGWGLIACNDGRTVEVVHAVTRFAPSLPWPAIVGVLRSAQGCGLRALELAEQRGFDRGVAYERRRAGLIP